MVEGMVREDDARAPARRPGFLLAAIVTPLVAAMLFVSWRLMGSLGLRGAMAGIAIGGSIALVGHRLREKVHAAQGPKMVRALMLSVVVSMGLFLAAALVVGLAWREAAAPALLCALGIYLAVSFHDAARSRN